MTSIDLTKTLNLLNPAIHSLDFKQDGTTLLVGTFGADVIEINSSGKLLNTLVSGHFRGVKGDINYPEVWGCATHPTKQIFASAGADMTVRIWSADKMISVSEKLPFDPTALDWSPDGLFIAVGDRNGTA